MYIEKEILVLMLISLLYMYLIIVSIFRLFIYVTIPFNSKNFKSKSRISSIVSLSIYAPSFLHSSSIKFIYSSKSIKIKIN